jgi:hypothetical protein
MMPMIATTISKLDECESLLSTHLPSPFLLDLFSLQTRKPKLCAPTIYDVDQGAAIRSEALFDEMIEVRIIKTLPPFH